MKILFYTLDKNIKVNEKYYNQEPDIIVVYGGDGTFLNALKDHMHLNVPFYGIAGGTLNFLMNTHKDLNNTLKLIESNELKIEFKETPTINVFLNNMDIGYAINDIVIGDSLRSYSTMTIDNKKYPDINKTIKGSAILLSTPLGSTAMNINNGGHPVAIKFPIWQISTIVCNDNFRKRLDDTDKDVHLNIKKLDNRYETMIVIDGKARAIMNENDIISFKTGKYFKIGFENYDEFNRKRIAN